MISRKIRPIRVGMPKVSDSVEKYYPSFNLRLTDLPAAKDWEVGKEYDIEMTVRLSSKTENEKYGGNYTFEIKEVSVDEDDE